MKSFIFCAAVGALFGVSAVSASCHAATAETALAANEVTYCEEYARVEYREAVAAEADFPDAAYEGAEEECEVQWLALAAQWDDPANLSRVAGLALRAGAVAVDMGAR